MIIVNNIFLYQYTVLGVSMSPDPLNFKELLDSIEKVESRINAYWNFYMLVVLAVMGWLFTVDTLDNSFVKSILTIALLLYFVSNFGVIRAATIRVMALECELNQLTKNSEFRSSELKRAKGQGSMYSAIRLK